MEALRNLAVVASVMTAATSFLPGQDTTGLQKRPMGGAFELRSGVVVDLGQKLVYLMSPQGVMDAVHLSRGTTVWSAKQVAKPLGVVGDLLICQAESSGKANELKIIAFDARRRGHPVVESTLTLPPGVDVSINEQPTGWFVASARAATRDVREPKAAIVSWRFARRRLDGDPQGEGGETVSLGGSFRIDLSTGEAFRINDEEPSLAPNSTAAALPSGERVPGVSGPQFLSADGAHVSTSRRVADSFGKNYRVTIYRRCGAERVGEFNSPFPALPFFVMDSDVVVYASRTYSRMTENGPFEEPLKICAENLRTGQTLWCRAVRETAYRDRLPPPAATEDKPNPANQGRAKARKIVEAHLAKLKGADKGQLLDLQPGFAEVLGKSFRGCEFFVLRFRKYPVALVPPKPLDLNNLCVVSKGEVTRITDERTLEDFFRKHLSAADSRDARADACRSWLCLAQELHQDGFFKFQQSAVEMRGAAAQGVAAVVRKRGDKGELTVKMEFAGGRLKSVQTGGKLIPGIRPRCQAKRLLDDDPVIREIMRRDVLVMGRACKWYLDEVRAGASAELKHELDRIWQRILDEGR